MNERLEAFGDWFVDGDWPDATCPTCGVGNLRVDSIGQHETFVSEDSRTHDAWEPEWVRGFFAAILRCQRSKCREIVIASGEWRVRDRPFVNWENPDAQMEYDDQYRLQTTIPPLPIMTDVDFCPQPVQDALTKASQVIWVDPGAAGNRLRLAVELALDAVEIPRSGGSAHARIKLLHAKNAEAAKYLEAVKWIGNQATHEDSLSVSDVLEAARILHRALALLFDPTVGAIDRRTQEIIDARGLPKTLLGDLPT